MFLGTHHHRLDAKGRLMLPKAFRPYLGTQVVLTRGLGGDQCLYLFPLPKWEELIAKLDALPLGSRQARLARRWIMGNAHLVIADRLGRILIPASLREAVGIQQDVVIIGLQTYIELWAPEAWEAMKTEAQENALTEDQWAALGI